MPRARTEVARRRARRRRLVSLVWALAPLATFGLATTPVIGYAARRLRSRGVAAAACGYAVWTVVGLVVFGGTEEDVGLRVIVGSGIVFGLTFVGTIHALDLRSATFGLDALDVDIRARRRALRMVASAPKEALRFGVGQVDIPESERLPDGGLIDANNASATALSRCAGLDAQTAEALVAARAVEPFSSTPELELRLALPPRLLDAVRDRLVYLPILGRRGAAGLRRQRGLTPLLTGGGVPAREATRWVTIGSWLWAALPALGLGMLTAPVIAFAAARLRSRWLWVSTAAYVTTTVFFFAAVAPDNYDGTVASDVGAYLILATAALGTLQALLVRHDVFEVDVIRSDRRRRRAARRLAQRDPEQAIRLQIGRTDIDERERYPDGGLIDLNNIPLAAVVASTGVDAATAQRIVDARAKIGGFESTDDLLNLLAIPPHLLDAVEERLIYLPIFGSGGRSGQ